MGKIVFAAPVLAAALLAGPAAAETDTFEKDAGDCNKVVSLPPDQVVAACSRLLADPEVKYGMKRTLVAPLFFNRAFAYHKLKDFGRALLDLNFAIGYDATLRIAYLLRGKVKADMGQDPAAIADYTHCLRLNARDDVCYFNRATAYSRLKNYPQAVRDFSAVIQIEPKAANAYAGRGAAREWLRQNQAALADYRMAVTLGSSDPQVLHRITALEAGAAPGPGPGGSAEQYREACFNAPNPQSGIAACTRRIQAGGGTDRKEQSDTFNTRAWWRYKAGQYQLALADVNRAITLDPSSAPAYDTRGHIYRGLGRRDDAIRDFRQSLALSPRPDTRRSAEQGLAALGISVAPAPGTPVDFTWRFRNNTGGSVQVKMYARERRNWWPSATTNWRMDSVGPYAFTISCRYGEKVCYGAWQVGNTDRYWGTGFQDKHGCESCCYACKEGQTTIYNLNP